MVEAWLGEYTDATLFLLMDNPEKIWLAVSLYAGVSNTQFKIWYVDSLIEASESLPAMFLHEWVRVCLSLDTEATIRLVVDGLLLEERNLGAGGAHRPQNLTMAHWRSLVLRRVLLTFGLRR